MHPKSDLRQLLSVNEKGLKKMEITPKSDINNTMHMVKGVELRNNTGQCMKYGGKIMMNPESLKYKLERMTTPTSRLGGLKNIGPSKD